MKINTQKEIEQSNTAEASQENLEPNPENSGHLLSDQEFKELREAYENADFERCYTLLGQLEKPYPDHPILKKYREEIDIRQTVKSVAQEGIELEKQKRKKSRLRLGLFAVSSTLLVFIVFVYSYFYFNIKVSAKQLEEEASLLMQLDEQVEQLLLVGKPRDAAEVLQQVRSIDSNYEGLFELESRTYHLLLIEEKYHQAMSLIEQDNPDEALAAFLQIENEWPGLWDVRQQINALENQN
jgi:hypothetical protein